MNLDELAGWWARARAEDVLRGVLGATLHARYGETIDALHRLGALERVLSLPQLLVAKAGDGNFFAEYGVMPGSDARSACGIGTTALDALLALADVLESRCSTI